jgi:hypothetical protein
MRIGELNPYRYTHVSKPKNYTSNVEKLNPLQKKNETIDEHQSKDIKEIDNMRTKLEEADKEIRKMKDIAEIELKCTIISRRIISGHKVPKSDYIYLAKNDSTLYQKAIILRIEREKPLKFKRISEYEKVKCFDIQSPEQHLYK